MNGHVNVESWTDESLYDLAEWQNGLAFKNIDFSDSGKPVIKIAELKNGITKQTARTNAEYRPSVHVTKGDLLFSWSGNPDTSIDVFVWRGEDGWLNQHIFKVTPREDVDPDFLFFLLRWLRPTFAEIARNKQTTGLGHVTVRDLKATRVLLPPISHQLAIVRAIGPYERKIELNAQMSDTLECMAKAVFRDWFVDFGPVRRKMDGATDPVKIMGGLVFEQAQAEHLTALFPDDLSSKGIPSGWSIEALEGALTLAYGKALPKTARIEGPVPVYGSGGVGGSHDLALVQGPGIIVGRKGTVGSLFWEADDFYAIDTVFYVQPKAGFSLEYLWQLLRTLGLEKMNTDAAVPGLNRNNAYRLEVVLSDQPVRDAFTAIAGLLRNRIDVAERETRTLIETRDYLLPRLMTGQVRTTAAPKAID